MDRAVGRGIVRRIAAVGMTAGFLAAGSAGLAQDSGRAQDPVLRDVARSVFAREWTPAGAASASAGGLGPLYSATSCEACHAGGGRGRIETDAGGRLVGDGLVVRLVRPDGTPDPVYGRQIQTRSAGGPSPEAEVSLDFERREERFGDSGPITLSRPMARLRHLAYGPLAPDTVPVLRLAPDLAASAAIASLGGRFGWKADETSLEREIARAFALDFGIATEPFPDPAGDCTPHQTACRDQAASDEEAPAFVMAATIDLLRLRLAQLGADLHAAPLAGADGARTFAAMGCAACHAGSGERRGSPDILSDLRLHDLGPGLADPTPGVVDASLWRTAPLVGLGRALAEGRPLLHDGRARTLAEAILWHGGAATEARERYRGAPAEERRRLERWLATR